MTKNTLLAAIALALVGCSNSKKEEGLEPPAPATPTPAAGSGSGSGSAGSGSAAVAPPKPAAIREIGLATPESVLYDADTDTYLVANINGKPADVDDNGFISKLSPEDRKAIELKWIDGSKPDVKLDAPKGMAISGGVLWVADISVVRKFDAKTGKQLADVKIAGATFLNDVAPAADGGVYVTDSGLNAKYEPSGSDAVYSISKTGAVKPIAKAKELGGPNGVIAVGSEVWVVTGRDGTIYQVPTTGAPKPFKLPKGTLDGIVRLGDDFLVSSWEGRTVYQGHGETWKDLQLDIESPADIGWDSKRKKLLVPSFNKDEILLIDVP